MLGRLTKDMSLCGSVFGSSENEKKTNPCVSMCFGLVSLVAGLILLGCFEVHFAKAQKNVDIIHSDTVQLPNAVYDPIS